MGMQTEGRDRTDRKDSLNLRTLRVRVELRFAQHRAWCVACLGVSLRENSRSNHRVQTRSPGPEVRRTGREGNDGCWGRLEFPAACAFASANASVLSLRTLRVRVEFAYASVRTGFSTENAAGGRERRRGRGTSGGWAPRGGPHHRDQRRKQDRKVVLLFVGLEDYFQSR